MSKSNRRYPKNWGKYLKEQRIFEKYVEDVIFKEFLEVFPATAKITQLEVARWLVSKKWMENLQVYAYKSAVVAGYTGKFREFTDSMRFLPIEDGTVSAWANSYERVVAKRLVNRVKKNTKKLNSDVKIIEGAKISDLNSVKRVVSKMTAQTKATKLAIAKLEKEGTTMTESAVKKQLNIIKKEVEKDNIRNKYPAIVKESTDKVNKHQGKLVAQDLFMKQTNKTLVADAEKKKADAIGNDSKRELVLVGYWRLSPSHEPHYTKDGVDPCEVFANNDDGYGKGSHTEDNIKYPVTDSHFGCKCSLELVVEEKR